MRIMPRRSAFLFISSPETLAPFHFDAEYNVLFQIAGRKDFILYPPVAPWITVSARDWERGRRHERALAERVQHQRFH